MPYGWIEPDVALRHGGVIIYHSYNDDDANRRLEYHYNVDFAEQTGDFDIRELPEYVEGRPHSDVLRQAIENKSPLLMAAMEAADVADIPPQPWPLGPIADREKLPTQADLLAHLKKNGANGWVLNTFCHPHEEALSMDDLILRYPLPGVDFEGCHIVAVREGNLVLYYTGVDAEDYELYDLDNAKLLDTDTCGYLRAEMVKFAEHFLEAIKALEAEIAEKAARADHGKQDVSESMVEICPRCGKAMPLDPHQRALSRQVDVYICPNCGADEAMQDYNHVPYWAPEQWHNYPPKEESPREAGQA